MTRRNEYETTVHQLKSEMGWAHRINVTCTGQGTHKQAALLQMWVDKTNGERNVLAWPVSRNAQNVAPREFADRYRSDDITETIICNRCNKERSFAHEELATLAIEMAWENKDELDVSYAADLIPFARAAAESRETVSHGIKHPFKVAPQAVWEEHAKDLGLNVEGMTRFQIMHTVLYYFPEPRRVIDPGKVLNDLDWPGGRVIDWSAITNPGH